MDILKAGKGLGVGSLGRFLNSEVLHFNEVDSTFAAVKNTIASSGVEINYYGWKTANEKIDLKSELTISPNARYTRHVIQPSKEIAGICTGIVKHGVNYITNLSANKKWGYIATYGVQSLVPDKLGMALFYEINSVSEITEWQHDHLVVFKPKTNKITFYFLGAWEQEKEGIKSEMEFMGYLNEKLIELNNTNALK